MTTASSTDIRPIYWESGKVRMIDQTRLPSEVIWLELSDYRDVVDAIKTMKVRGAPAIGIAGAYAVALAALEIAAEEGSPIAHGLTEAAAEIRDARPTGANLGWAVDRMMEVAARFQAPLDGGNALVAEAGRIHREDDEANRTMGRLGAELLPSNANVLTHCNAGALATGGYGTALGVVRAARDAGKLAQVYATETRPLLQGARLTAWELVEDGIRPSLLPDSAAGQLLASGDVDAVVVGADRIAANGDVANKIGTYTLAVVARENGIPFYVAAPLSTIDLKVPSGGGIPIEGRPPDEVTHIAGARIAPAGVEVLNPAFDVTPHRYVTAIITEGGVAREPYGDSLRRLIEDAGG